MKSTSCVIANKTMNKSMSETNILSMCVKRACLKGPCLSRRCPLHFLKDRDQNDEASADTGSKKNVDDGDDTSKKEDIGEDDEEEDMSKNEEDIEENKKEEDMSKNEDDIEENKKEEDMSKNEEDIEENKKEEEKSKNEDDIEENKKEEEMSKNEEDIEKDVIVSNFTNVFSLDILCPRAPVKKFKTSLSFCFPTYTKKKLFRNSKKNIYLNPSAYRPVKKSVLFDETKNIVHLIPNRMDYSIQEYNGRWFTPDVTNMMIIANIKAEEGEKIEEERQLAAINFGQSSVTRSFQFNWELLALWSSNVWFE